MDLGLTFAGENRFPVMSADGEARLLGTIRSPSIPVGYNQANTMQFSPGDRLGPYEIVEPIGKGGMGEVYRGRDPRVGRDVAVKVCSAQFTERFEREARAVAALNHPNICTLYDARTMHDEPDIPAHPNRPKVRVFRLL